MKTFAALVTAVVASHSSRLRCVPTVTVTDFKGPKEGCNVQCQTGCIADAALTLPCGCTTAESIVTRTNKICPSAPCVSCTTGFGIFVTDDCPTTRPTPHPTHH